MFIIGVLDFTQVKYGQGQTYKTYDAKILRVKTPEVIGNQTEYFVHYAGWNARHDEWIPHSFIVGFAEEKATPSPAAGSAKSLSKRPRTPVNSRTSIASKDDLTPSPNASYDIARKFGSVVPDTPSVDDDLPDFQANMSRVAPMLIKKNLGDEFQKTCTTEDASADVKHAFEPFVVDGKTPFEPPHLVSLPKLKETLQNEKPSKAKEQEKQDTSIEEGARAETTVVKSEVMEVECIEHDHDGGRSNSPGAGSSSLSETSEDNSNASDSSTQARRTSGRHSKSPVYYEGGYIQGAKRKKRGGLSEKSRSPTPEIADRSNSSSPEAESVIETDTKSGYTTVAADIIQNKEAEKPGTSSNSEKAEVNIKEEVNADAAVTDNQIVRLSSSKESIKVRVIFFSVFIT